MLVVSAGLVSVNACGDPDNSTKVTATGGSLATGGILVPATGGVSQTGGLTATGGQTVTGGQIRPATGGKAQTGGLTATGGLSAMGGQAPVVTGGSVQPGGIIATGGQTRTGGQGPLGTDGGVQPDGPTATDGQVGTGGTTGGCVPTKTWGTADPAKPGPFEVLIEKEVGPTAGVPDKVWNNESPRFNLYRPKDLSQGYCHPIVTWGNGTGDQPKTYEVLIKQLASHGFVVVASLSSQTAQGTPLPQIAGIEWMIKENETPTSALYHKLDITKIGATGHSQGGAATTMAGADPRITAIAPICGSRANIKLNGPAALLCGGSDTMVTCDSVKSAYDTIGNQPVMLFNSLSDTHGSWIGSIANPFMVATTGWMRVHLMGDTANRGMFYGASFKFGTDTRVKVTRKMMDQ